MATATAGRRGRPPTATRTDVLRAVTEQYAQGQRVDVTVVSRRLGLSRATIYRWFGSRERLLGEVIARQLESLIERKRRSVGIRGAAGLLEVFDQINCALAQSLALRQFFEQEPRSALRLLTASTGVVQPRAVAAVHVLIADEVSAAAYDPAVDPATLAYAIVRLAEAFLYRDAAVGVSGDHERLREVEAALLGVPAVARP
jgi:AcrR family transcriptional regulator